MVCNDYSALPFSAYRMLELISQKQFCAEQLPSEKSNIESFKIFFYFSDVRKRS
jgi:hypothetical protein